MYDDDEIKPVTTSGVNDEFIHMDKCKYRRDELVRLLGKDTPQRFGNPTPLGLCAFATTMFLLSLFTLKPAGVTVPSVIVGVCFFYGGLVMILTGMWEIAVNNTFGALTFTSYGAFWLSYGAIMSDSFGIVSAYASREDAATAVGLYVIGWLVFTLLLTICTVRSTVAIFALFFTLDLALVFDIVFAFTGNLVASRVGAVLGILASLLAWYSALAAVANRSNTFFELRPWNMPPSLLN